ncbi:MAG: hypothetical protein ACK55I_10750, partial [bacterium]
MMLIERQRLQIAASQHRKNGCLRFVENQVQLKGERRHAVRWRHDHGDLFGLRDRTSQPQKFLRLVERENGRFDVRNKEGIFRGRGKSQRKLLLHGLCGQFSPRMASAQRQGATVH